MQGAISIFCKESVGFRLFYGSHPQHFWHQGANVIVLGWFKYITFIVHFISYLMLQKVTLVLGLEVGVTCFMVYISAMTLVLCSEWSNGQYIDKCHEHVTMNFYFTKAGRWQIWPVGCNFLIPEWNCSIEKAPLHLQEKYLNLGSDLWSFFWLDVWDIWTYTHAVTRR